MSIILEALKKMQMEEEQKVSAGVQQATAATETPPQKQSQASIAPFEAAEKNRRRLPALVFLLPVFLTLLGFAFLEYRALLFEQVRATWMRLFGPQTVPASAQVPGVLTGPALKLSGTFADGGAARYAIINDRLVTPGETIASAQVLEIGNGYVDVLYSGKTLRLLVGE